VRHLWPRSLIGSTLFVVAAGLVLAQIASIAVNLFDRGGAVYRLAARQLAVRIGETARILNRLPPSERDKVAGEVDSRTLRVALSHDPFKPDRGYVEFDEYETAFTAQIQRAIGAPWRTTVEITTLPKGRRGGGTEPPVYSAVELWIARNFYFLLPDPFVIVAQVVLEDGVTATFFAQVPQEPLGRLTRLVPHLLLWVVTFFVLAALAVRVITRPLDHLAQAADRLGANPDSHEPPLEETGPSEVRRLIRAFNRMQEQVRGFVLERTNLLAAISHDLKTPLTRLRLRAELLDDPALRAKLLRDVAEMQAMAGSTLDFVRSLGRDARRQPVDVGALLDRLREDWRETGVDVAVEGTPCATVDAHPEALRRCLDNLIENAIRYGGRAHVRVEDDGDALRIDVGDDGPGIPEAELERVFEPFFRLEPSRNRASGGTGLGLSIARNIARWHGGEVTLRNGAGGRGLIAEIRLPRARRDASSRVDAAADAGRSLDAEGQRRERYT
jgi:signal transduction histidine kinase